MWADAVEWPRPPRSYVRKRRLTIAFCLLTAIPAGVTVWSFDGSFTITAHGSNEYQDRDERNTCFLTPFTRGILTFLTVGMFFISMASMISLQAEDLKPSSG